MTEASDLGDLAERLEAIVSELDERSFDILREASAAGAARPKEDKRLTQARRAIEKAIHLLRNRDPTVDD